MDGARSPWRHARADRREAQRRHQRRFESLEARASFTKIGFETRPGSAQEFASRIAGDSDKWAAVIRLTGAKID